MYLLMTQCLLEGTLLCISESGFCMRALVKGNLFHFFQKCLRVVSHYFECILHVMNFPVVHLLFSLCGRCERRNALVPLVWFVFWQVIYFNSNFNSGARCSRVLTINSWVVRRFHSFTVVTVFMLNLPLQYPGRNIWGVWFIGCKVTYNKNASVSAQENFWWVFHTAFFFLTRGKSRRWFCNFCLTDIFSFFLIPSKS